MFGLPNPYVILVAAAIWFASMGVAGFEGWHQKSLNDDAAIAVAEAHVIAIQAASDKISNTVVVADQVAQLQIQAVTQTIIKEVPVYVTKIADSRCIVPVGFVRLHDSAASGVLVVPGPAADADDAASGVALSAVAGTVAGNYGSCHADQERLKALQGWVAEQGALFNGTK